MSDKFTNKADNALTVSNIEDVLNKVLENAIAYADKPKLMMMTKGELRRHVARLENPREDLVNIVNDSRIADGIPLYISGSFVSVVEDS